MHDDHELDQYIQMYCSQMDCPIHATVYAVPLIPLLFKRVLNVLRFYGSRIHA